MLCQLIKKSPSRPLFRASLETRQLYNSPCTCANPKGEVACNASAARLKQFFRCCPYFSDCLAVARGLVRSF